MSKIEVKMSIKEFDDLRKRSEELDITIRALLNINTVLAAPIYQTSEQRLKRITELTDECFNKTIRMPKP